jgi:hypothetical protein
MAARDRLVAVPARDAGLAARLRASGAPPWPRPRMRGGGGSSGASCS